MLFAAIGSLAWGTYIDKHRKKHVMVVSSTFTLIAYALAGIIYLLFPTEALTSWQSGMFWLFIAVVLAGGVVENMRNIALSTVVTILVDKDKRDKANGAVGAVQGVGFLVTSVFSGLAIGFLGMGWAIGIAVFFTAVALLHLLFVRIDEPEIVHDPELANKRVDIKGALAAIRVVPGLIWLIIFTTFNNLVGGVYIALMDPYGLTLFSVQMWGIIFGITSIGYIIGGLIIAKRGLGKSPLRAMLLANIIVGLVGAVFTIRELWLLYTIGIFIYMAIMPIIEAAEQTIIQRVVPLAKQGRVFGFAYAFEIAAAPISAFLIGPIAEFFIIPYMSTAEGQQSFEWLLGTGDARGIALVFVCAGLIMCAAVLVAFKTRAYRILSKAYQKA